MYVSLYAPKKLPCPATYQRKSGRPGGKSLERSLIRVPSEHFWQWQKLPLPRSLNNNLTLHRKLQPLTPFFTSTDRLMQL